MGLRVENPVIWVIYCMPNRGFCWSAGVSDAMPFGYLRISPSLCKCKCKYAMHI
jgi:hypothetical protein